MSILEIELMYTHYIRYKTCILYVQHCTRSYFPFLKIINKYIDAHREW